MPYYIVDPKRDPNLQNYPIARAGKPEDRNLYRRRASEGLQALCLGLPKDWAD